MVLFVCNNDVRQTNAIIGEHIKNEIKCLSTDKIIQIGVLCFEKSEFYSSGTPHQLVHIFSTLSIQKSTIDNTEYPKSNPKVPPTDVSKVIES